MPKERPHVHHKEDLRGPMWDGREQGSRPGSSSRTASRRSPYARVQPPNIYGQSSRRPGPSPNSYFQDSRNVDISGGEFNSTLGHHTNLTINLNQTEPGFFPTEFEPDVSTREYDQMDLEMDILDYYPNVFASQNSPPVQRSNQICERHLSLKGRGFPLWIPEANKNLPLPYQRKGINTGDVGIITPSGSFSFLFNICLLAEDPINPRELPNRFSPINPPIDPIDIRRIAEFKSGSYLARSLIEKSQNDPDSGGLSFEAGASEGAILALPEGATSQDYENIPKFRAYAAEHAQDWYRHANGPRGREAKNGDVRLVIGCDKTTSWGMAVLANMSQERTTQLKFKTTEESRPSSSASSYAWEYSGMAEVRAGPDLEEIEELRKGDYNAIEFNAKYANQCLFVRTLNLTLSDDLWEKVNHDLGLSQVQEGNGDQSQHTGDPKSMCYGQGDSGDSNSGGNVGGSYGNQGVHQYHSYPDTHFGITMSLTPNNMSFHPSENLNGLLLKMVPTS